MEKYLFFIGYSDIHKGGGLLSTNVNEAARNGFTLVSAGSMPNGWSHPLWAVMVKLED